MEFAVRGMGSEDIGGDTLVLTAWTDGITGLEHWPGIPASLLTNLWKKGTISGKAQEITAVFCQSPTPWEQILVLGLGGRKKFTPEDARLSGAVLVKELRKLKAKTVAIAANLDSSAVAGLVQGLILGDYSFDHYKGRGGSGKLELSLFFVADESVGEQLAESIAAAAIEADAVNYVRDLVNEPGNKLSPVDLAREAQILARRFHLECQLLGLQTIKQLQMGGLLGVAQGSSAEPRLIVLKYTGDPQATKSTLGLVGKGLTFDAGGISLKTAEGLRGEKSDMAGGAAVMGAMAAIAQLKLPLNVIGIIPAAENLPSGSALKPDDILTLLDGTTVEIISTDAEGRLILADAIAYARKLQLAPIVDIATLTGHCSIAIGPYYAGLWSNDPKLQQQLVSAASTSGEKIWPMPYDGGFLELTKGVFAELKNSGGREGGACTAAAFLGHFAGKDPWAHLDIAPTAFADNGKGYVKQGGTGFGVRTLVQFARILAG